MSKSRPTAAPARFPYREHRTMQQVDFEKYHSAIGALIGDRAPKQEVKR